MQGSLIGSSPMQGSCTASQNHAKRVANAVLQLHMPLQTHLVHHAGDSIWQQKPNADMAYLNFRLMRLCKRTKLPTGALALLVAI